MYGEFRWADKYKTWDRLRLIHQQKTIPWLVLGDLNEILYSHEKEGGNARPQRYIQAFHHAIENYEIDDIGFIGDPFTWHRGAMRSRLDRGLANASWNQLHSNAALVHLQYNHSNHRPLLLDTEFYTTPSNNPINRLRNFEEKWFREEGFCSVVEENWNSAANEQGVIDVLYRLKAMHAGLHAWDHRVLKKPKQQLRPPASTIALTSSGLVRGSASSPLRSLNFAMYPVLRSSAPVKGVDRQV